MLALEELTMSLGVYTEASERVEPTPDVEVKLPPSYLVSFQWMHVGM